MDQKYVQTKKSIFKQSKIILCDINHLRVFKLGRDNPLIEKMIAGEKGDGEDRNISLFPLGQLYPANTGQC